MIFFFLAGFWESVEQYLVGNVCPLATLSVVRYICKIIC